MDMNETLKYVDGQWVPVSAIPYYIDSRPIRVKVWHTVLVLLGWDIDQLMERWWVPSETW